MSRTNRWSRVSPRRERSRARLVLPVVALVTGLALALPGTASAIEPYTFTVILEGTLGGPLQESEGDAGLDNSGFQLGFSLVGVGEVHIGGRLGSIDFDEGLGSLGDVDLDYLHLGADYRFREGFYDSGVYIGIGQYEIEGTTSAGTVIDEDSLGLALGVTGEFELAPNIGLMLEVTTHVTDLDAAELFLTGHAGVAIHF